MAAVDRPRSRLLALILLLGMYAFRAGNSAILTDESLACSRLLLSSGLVDC